MCCDDAQPGARVEEEQEVDDVRRHGEVAQDEVAGAVRGGVEGLAGAGVTDVGGIGTLKGTCTFGECVALSRIIANILPC